MPNRKHWSNDDWALPVVGEDPVAPLPAAPPPPRSDTSRAHGLLASLIDCRDFDVARLTALLLAEVSDLRAARKAAKP